MLLYLKNCNLIFNNPKMSVILFDHLIITTDINSIMMIHIIKLYAIAFSNAY